MYRRQMPSTIQTSPTRASSARELPGLGADRSGDYTAWLRLATQLAQAVATIVDYASAVILWLVVFAVYPSPMAVRSQQQAEAAGTAGAGSALENDAQVDQKQASKQLLLINKMCDDLLDKGSNDGEEDGALSSPDPWSPSFRRRFKRKESTTSSVAVEDSLSPRSTIGSDFDVPDWVQEDVVVETHFITRPKSASSTSVPDSAMDEMRLRFPEADEDILARFLIARKSVLSAASELYSNHLRWRSATLPLHDGDVAKVMETQCLYVRGRTKDDTPMLVFRGGFYDNTLASSDQYVLAAVYLLEKMVVQGMDKVTVLVNVAALPGGVNAPPDISFIKQLASVLSDNYPERLHRLVLYPFPWIGTAVWNVVKMFIDQRTRDRIVLISGKASQGAPVPQKLFDYVDPDQLAPMLGGTDTTPIDPYIVKW